MPIFPLYFGAKSFANKAAKKSRSDLRQQKILVPKPNSKKTESMTYPNDHD